MLKKITMNNVASYTDCLSFDNLEKFNFFYGSNGCGKSTIAKFLNCHFNSIRDSKYFDMCSCEADFIDHHRRRNLFVYDADYVSRVITQEKLSGIFVLGEDAVEKQNELEIIEVGIRQNEEEKRGADRALVGLNAAREKHTNQFYETCWETKLEFDATFTHAMSGYRGTKKAFAEKCLIHANTENEIDSFSSLQKNYQFYFGENGAPQTLIELPSFAWRQYTTLDGHKILSQKIQGKEDTTVAELITLLGNSDWVAEGMNFLTTEKCPFCQQAISLSLKEDLEKYFDRIYFDNITLLTKFINDYYNETEALIERINKYRMYESTYLEIGKIDIFLTSLIEKIEKNKLKLNSKLKEPSICTTLSNLDELLLNIEEYFFTVNKEIKAHNDLINNFKNEKNKYINRLWDYIAQNVKVESALYTTKVSLNSEKIQNIKDRTDRYNKEITRLKNEKSTLLNSMTNSSIPLERINNILLSSGFHGFHIREEEGPAHYSIVRDNGESANTTLSEGEKTFIAFLYFYQQCLGLSGDGNVDPKIIVFDDPVSSLDSSTLHMISSLIRRMIKEHSNNNINQVFLLTHNLYFFKEVTYLKNTGGVVYWLIRKDNRCSTVERFEKNPIRSSYQLLWNEVKRAKEDPSIDIRNTLRRIIESYFSFFGGKSMSEIPQELVGEVDSQICNWLLQVANDGSHGFYDDLHISILPSNERWLTVFKQVFYKLGHKEHYDMMLESSDS